MDKSLRQVRDHRLPVEHGAIMAFSKRSGLDYKTAWGIAARAKIVGF